MKFFAGLFALMAVTSVAAVPYPRGAQDDQVAAAKGGAGKAAAVKGGVAGLFGGGVAAANAGNAGKGDAAAKAAAAKAKADADAAAAALAAGNSTATADNSTASVDNSTATADNSTASVDNSANATATATASGATRTRACDMGDQALAGGLQASVLIGIGQQASVVTLQGAAAAADFADGVTRLQQFVDTQALQLQMIQGIADDDSFAQTQIALLATSGTAQAALVKGLTDAKASAADLTTLLDSFTTSTGVAQDGANQALIDCFLPLTAVSG